MWKNLTIKLDKAENRHQKWSRFSVEFTNKIKSIQVDVTNNLFFTLRLESLKNN